MPQVIVFQYYCMMLILEEFNINTILHSISTDKPMVQNIQDYYVITKVVSLNSIVKYFIAVIIMTLRVASLPAKNVFIQLLSYTKYFQVHCYP